MIKRTLLSVGLFGLLALLMYCNDEKGPTSAGPKDSDRDTVEIEDPDQDTTENKDPDQDTVENEDPLDPQDPKDSTQIYGGFVLSLVAPDGITATYAQLQGNLKDGPAIYPIVWDEAEAIGNCRLMKPRIPFCENDCGTALCVEDDSCQYEPSPVYAGKIEVSGLKTTGSSGTFIMDTIRSNYQLPSGVSLSFPPFEEGDMVNLTIKGNSTIPSFTMSAMGIKPLVVYNDTISIIDGEPIVLKWEPPSNPGNSTISIKIDISHHGGTKGIIECECPDNGSVEIPAVLLGKLKALGMAGFPKIEITRRATGTSSTTNAKIMLESTVTKLVHIPGLISCWGDSEDECPDGQVCEDFRCK